MATTGIIRLAEIVAALSLASDLGMGQPWEFALQSCILALRLGDALGYSDELLREIYYQSLLRYIGCNVETHLLASVVGDEFAFRRDFTMVDHGNPAAAMKVILRHIRQANADAAPLDMLKAVAHGLMTVPHIRASIEGHCEVAQRLAARLGLGSNIVRAFNQLFERWDGKGAPHGLKGEAIAPTVLAITLAQDTLLFYRLGGVSSAISVARERRGTNYAPHIVDCFCEHAEQLLAGLEDPSSWKTVMDLEPGEHQWLDEEQFDTACRAMADFVDIKSPATLNHSRYVADLAGLAAQQVRLPATNVAAIRRAGWLHDVGKTGISSTILEKPGGLSEQEWERVRLHPYFAERILSHADPLLQLGKVCALHHERLDGSGYHRGLPASMIPFPVRLLSAANTYCALLQNRSYRAALRPDEAARVLNRDVQAGKLDGEAAHAVLTAAGHQTLRREEIAQLTDRELEVLRLVARGLTTRQIAEALAISPKTADHHIQHIYSKIGVSTRAGATLFVMEHNLLH